MSGGVLNAAMLLGLLGAALPVLIHLLNRRRDQVVDWGAMQFLDLGRRARRKIRLTELLLMLARMALLAPGRPGPGAAVLGAGGDRLAVPVRRPRVGRPAARRRARDRRLRQHGPPLGGTTPRALALALGPAIRRANCARATRWPSCVAGRSGPPADRSAELRQDADRRRAGGNRGSVDIAQGRATCPRRWPRRFACSSGPGTPRAT